MAASSQEQERSAAGRVTGRWLLVRESGSEILTATVVSFDAI